MIQTAIPHPNHNHQPFLPNNFYEAPQYEAFRPPEAATLHGEPSHTRHQVFNLDVPKQSSPDKSIALTQTLSTPLPGGRRAERESRARAREIRGQLDNLHLLYELHTQKGGEPIRFATPVSRTYTNVCQAQGTSPGPKLGRGRPKKVVVNRLKPYLQRFIFPKDALLHLPMFDDIVAGTVRADMGGNTRSFGKTIIVSFLQRLDVLSAEAVQEEMKGSLRNAQKMAMCLRIIEREAFKVAEKHWYHSSDIDWSDFD